MPVRKNAATAIFVGFAAVTALVGVMSPAIATVTAEPSSQTLPLQQTVTQTKAAGKYTTPLEARRSPETNYLNSFLNSRYALSLTVTTAQRPRSRPGPNAGWEPGLTSYGWSNLGGRGRDTSGRVTSLIFSSQVWFSDRVVNRGASPTAWQQFSATDPDPVVFTFTISGSHVHMKAYLRRWGATWEANSFAYNSATQQLMFIVPGAGAGAPPAVMLTSFGPGAGFL